MPGPGGGGNGGGFGGGGFGGGGFGGGGFGGGGFGGRPPRRHHYYRRPFFGGWYHRPYYYGGGCLGGFFGMLMLPIIALIIAALLLVGSVSNLVTTVANGGRVEYNESKFQSYANARYYEEFDSRDPAFEDHLLIVFLTNEEHDSYYTIAFVGNNVVTGIKNDFGNEYTSYGRAVQQNVADYHEFSLSANLAAVMEDMEATVVAKGLKSSHYDAFSHEGVAESHLTNHTDLNINEQTVNKALVSFTEATNIPAVIVVDDVKDVFFTPLTALDVLSVVALVVIIGVAIFFIVRAVKNRKNSGGDDPNRYNYERDYNPNP
jgi:uncharacterized membrane protein